jgi:hypothetical protein
MAERPPDESHRNPSDDITIDSVCAEFARQWKIAERPLIEDALARVPVENQLALLKRLLPLELEIGRANGDLPQASEYSEQLMAFGDAITDILRE